VNLIAEVVATVSRNEAVCIAFIVVVCVLAIWYAWNRMGDDD
jgi:hypothetical protein